MGVIFGAGITILTISLFVYHLYNREQQNERHQQSWASLKDKQKR